MKINKVFAMLLAVFVVSFVFSGCGKSKKSVSKDDSDMNDIDFTDMDIDADDDNKDDDDLNENDDIEKDDLSFPDEVVADPDIMENEIDDDSEVIHDNDNNLPDENTDELSGGDSDTDEILIPDSDEDSDEEIGDLGDPETICTGLEKCFDNDGEIGCPLTGTDFYGQDYQYSLQGFCKPRNFSIAGIAPEETVTDNLTGLVWQRTLPQIFSGCTGGTIAGARCNWQESVNYCENLVYSGFDDWRLPSIEEISTIPDYGKYIPAIDQIAFPDTTSTYFWTATTHKAFANYAWLAYFNNGDVEIYLKTKEYPARCVRGSVFNNQTDYLEKKIFGKTVVIDTKTNLVWAKEYSTGKSWKDALKYCEDSVYAGFSDWRLPNVNELKSLLNYSSGYPSSGFPEMPSQSFWASTSYLGYSEYAWYVNFNYGEVYYHTKKNIYHTRCLR